MYCIQVPDATVYIELHQISVMAVFNPMIMFYTNYVDSFIIN